MPPSPFGPVWTQVDGIVPGTGGIVGVIDPGMGGPGVRFYRIRLAP